MRDLMDRALKERIIGAAVLVIVVVLVVPVFLDGPPGEGEVISEKVPLPGQAEQGTKTVVLIAVMGFLTGRPDFLDLCLVYALINFIGTIAVLKFFEYGDLGLTRRLEREAE